MDSSIQHVGSTQPDAQRAQGYTRLETYRTLLTLLNDRACQDESFPQTREELRAELERHYLHPTR